MRKATYLFLLLGCLVLSSCRDMFNKMIEYKGNEEPPVLCLNADVKVGSPLKVYLTHSWFFLDENRYVGTSHAKKCSHLPSRWIRCQTIKTN